MRICDGCKKPLPLGTINIIHVTAMGGELSKYFSSTFGADSLDFCSLQCFIKFAESIPSPNPSKRADKK